MARKLKVYRTSIGFFDLAVAAPSMKAAAEAWGSDPDIFSRGFAEQTEDPKIVKAAMASPGVVLRRPVGSDGAFGEKAALPKPPKQSRKEPEPRPEKANDNRKPDTKAAEKAKREEAAALEREEKRQALERQKREAEEERARKRREQMIAKANASFEKARERHGGAMESLAKRRGELDKDQAHEQERWEGEQRDHKDALKEAEG